MSEIFFLNACQLLFQQNVFFSSCIRLRWWLTIRIHRIRCVSSSSFSPIFLSLVLISSYLFSFCWLCWRFVFFFSCCSLYVVQFFFFFSYKFICCIFLFFCEFYSPTHLHECWNVNILHKLPRISCKVYVTSKWKKNNGEWITRWIKKKFIGDKIYLRTTTTKKFHRRYHGYRYNGTSITVVKEKNKKQKMNVENFVRWTKKKCYNLSKMLH